MAGRTGVADTRRVAVEVLSRDQVRTVDSIELPPPGEPVVGRAERRDSYPILVTRSPEETIERLLQAIGDARVYGFECSAEVVGSDATLRIGGGARPVNVDVLADCGSLSRVAEDHIERHLPAYREELRQFVACVRDGSEPSVGGEDAVAALELAAAAERSVAPSPPAPPRRSRPPAARRGSRTP